MSTGRITAVVVLLLSFFILPELVQAKYSGGTGTPNDPYLISNAEDMNQIGRNYTDWDKCFRLIDDINLSAYTGTQFSRIGTDDKHGFSGVFDGNGHTISGFTYTAESGEYIGVFGNVSAAGRVENVFLVDVNVTGSRCVGGLAGYNEGTINNSSVTGTVSGSSCVGGLVGENKKGTISNCNSTDAVTGSGDYPGLLGGLVGYNYNGSISNCYSTAAVTGGYYSGCLGGLVGGNDDDEGNISSCYSTGAVTAGDYSYYIGGLVGTNAGGGTISNCHSTGIVTGGNESDCLGGLVGENYWYSFVTDCYATGGVVGDYDVGGLVGLNDHSTITRCYSSGSVSGYMYVGGLLGWNYGGTTTDSFWDIETSGQSWSAGGTGRTTAEMMTESTFTDAGWDFVWETANGTEDIWAMCEGVSYPKLAWQFIPGDFDNDKDVDFVDFAQMGQKWSQADSNLYCGGMDLTGDGWVDWNDLAMLCNYWLEGL